MSCQLNDVDVDLEENKELIKHLDGMNPNSQVTSSARRKVSSSTTSHRCWWKTTGSRILLASARIVTTKDNDKEKDQH